MRTGIIYKTTNQVNGKWYIGKYQGTRPGYLGSGVALSNAIKKYGKENFTKETIAECEIGKSLADLERKIILESGAIIDPMSYNISEGQGGRTWDYPPRTKEHCENISKALLGRDGGTRTIETKNKMSIVRRMRSDSWKIIFINTGNEIITNCLGEFSKKHNIAGKTLRYSANNHKVVKGMFLVTKLEKNNGNS